MSKIVDSHDDAEDVVQEVFLAVYEGVHSFANVSELTNYLYKACYNNSGQFLRNHNIHSKALDALDNPELESDEDLYTLSIREEVIRQLYHCINELPSEQKKIMMLRISGKNWNEIAEILGLSINTIKTQKSRSYKYLRKRLDESQLTILLLFL